MQNCKNITAPICRINNLRENNRNYVRYSLKVMRNETFTIIWSKVLDSSGSDTISVSDLSGLAPTVLVSGGLEEPRAIVLHPGAG